MCTNPNHQLRLVLSCRKLTAQVTQPTTASIIAMASSSEQEFVPLYRARLNRFPRHNRLWDSRTAARVGDKLAFRLHDIRVSAVSIDLQEELSRPLHLHQLVLLLFDFVRHVGVLVHGAEKLWVAGSVLMSSIRNGRALLSLNLAIAAATITNVCQATVV